ncbi:hypothetical protein D3C87_1267500 [compost metagenome]
MTHSSASFETMIKEGTIKRADAMKVRYSDIRVKEGVNLRDLDDEYETGIEALASYILAGVTFPALEVIALPDGSGVEVVDGHRRYDAIGRAIQRGAPIGWVAVVGFQGNEIERRARIYTSNEGVKLRPLEAARGFKRFRGMGLDTEEIAALVHRSRPHIENYLVLTDAEPDVHTLVRHGAVSVEVAIDAIRKHGAQAGAFLTGKVDQATAAGKAKVTASTIHGLALPSKVVSSLISGVDTFMLGLSTNQRATLLDTQEGRVASEAITIPTAALLNLFQAHGAVETVRAKRAEKAAKDAQQAAPDAQAPIDLNQQETTA